MSREIPLATLLDAVALAFAAARTFGKHAGLTVVGAMLALNRVGLSAHIPMMAPGAPDATATPDTMPDASGVTFGAATLAALTSAAAPLGHQGARRTREAAA
ncbi:hypothetical protein [Gymnodinialimonas ceratoperidinii]|uniref:Uncharacterized protein n=1 Tax=Gymnodinialimonas ceratoperidinii TaxID=2856823 RepID=A0A8F6TYI9_9RHOB|nr:hypothetical protein [Gymnodinialimonas ceratoperidinii]QXT41261.1 hypothetical protein KYE46_08640 [Gymnodinialimonas ceratoperidinii]